MKVKGGQKGEAAEGRRRDQTVFTLHLHLHKKKTKVSGVRSAGQANGCVKVG